MPSSPRRFPPPWSIEELNDACFIVSDSAGQKLAYVYFEEPGRRSAAKLLTKDELQPRMKLVTSYLVVHKGQIPVQALLQAGPPDAVQPPPGAAALR
jgi:hypothetical protein